MLFPESLRLVTDTLWRVSKDDIEWFLEDVFTPAEIVEIADRITLVQHLKDGKTQREVAQEQGISVTTVSRGARVMKFGRGMLEKYA